MTWTPVDGARIGMLTPSSNTVLEPLTAAMFAPFGEAASAHFGRFRVVEISMSVASRDQFQLDAILEAADRLAEAKPRLIVWNGTSAAWLGQAKDLALCAAIEDRTGIRATTTMLAFDRVLRRLGARRLGLVTPYIDDIQARIVANFAEQGLEVVSERHLRDKGNFSFASYPAEQVAAMVAAVAEDRPDAIVIVCTNFRGATITERMERATGIPVLDSVAVTAAHSLDLAGLDCGRVGRWGSVFRHLSRTG